MPEEQDSLTPAPEDFGSSNNQLDTSSDGMDAAPLSEPDDSLSTGNIDMTGQPIDEPVSYDDLPEPPTESLADITAEPESEVPDELNSFDNQLEAGEGEENSILNATAVDNLSTSGNGKSGKGNRMGMLLLTTGLLMIGLAAAVWFFFLRDQEPNAPAVTPTPTVSVGSTSPTPLAGGSTNQTHLECRFGLCVEVPGPGANLCSSSFDCEDGGTGTATTPSPTSATASPTSLPSPTTAEGAPQATSTPVVTATKTPAPTTPPVTTLTPTPLAAVLPESGAVQQTIVLALGSLLLVSSGILLARRKTA